MESRAGMAWPCARDQKIPQAPRVPGAQTSGSRLSMGRGVVARGLGRLLRFMAWALVYPVTTSEGQVITYEQSDYAMCLCVVFYQLLLITGWRFAMHCLQSAIAYSYDLTVDLRRLVTIQHVQGSSKFDPAHRFRLVSRFLVNFEVRLTSNFFRLGRILSTVPFLAPTSRSLCLRLLSFW